MKKKTKTIFQFLAIILTHLILLTLEYALKLNVNFPVIAANTIIGSLVGMILSEIVPVKE